MSIAPIISLARKEAGDDVEAQRDWLAYLVAATLDEYEGKVSKGYIRAAPRTGPSEEEIAKSKVDPLLIPGEVQGRDA